MAWTVKLADGFVFDSDDMTLDDLGRIEKDTGTPWSILNPWKDMKVAKAFLVVAMQANGAGQDEAYRAVDAMRLRDVKAMFDFRDDDEKPATASGGDADPLDRSSRTSSRGARSGSSGPRKKPAAKG